MDYITLLCVERELDSTTISKDGLEKVQKDPKKSACEEYLSCLFILVPDSGSFQRLNIALDNQFLLYKYAYPTTMPQALKLLEKFKAEVGATPKGRTDSVDDSGVAFAQAQSWAQSMVFHHCGIKGHRVNKCPKLNHAQGKNFWKYCNKDRREKSNTEPKEGTDNAAVAEVVFAIPEENDAARIKYECFQRLISAMEELEIWMIQVGHSDTGVVEDMNSGVNMLSRGTSNTGKSVH